MRGSVRSAGVGARPKQRDDETELEVEQMEDSPDQNTRVVDLNDVLRDVSEYHGVTSLGYFILYFALCNMVMFMHWDSNTPVLKSSAQEGFLVFGDPPVGSAYKLEAVDTMLEAAQYIRAFSAYWVAVSETRSLPPGITMIDEYSVVSYMRISAALEENCRYPNLYCKTQGRVPAVTFNASGAWSTIPSIPGVNLGPMTVAVIIGLNITSRSASAAILESITNDLPYLAQYSYYVSLDMVIANQPTSPEPVYISLQFQRNIGRVLVGPDQELSVTSISATLTQGFYTSQLSKARIGVELVFLVMTIGYLLHDFDQGFLAYQQFDHSILGVKRFLSSFWAIVDFISHVFTAAWCGWYIILMLQDMQRDKTVTATSSSVDRSLSFNLSFEVWQYVGILCSMLIGVRVLKYMRLHASLRIYSAVLSNTWKTLRDFLFFFLYLLLLIGFSVLAFFQLSGGNSMFTTVAGAVQSITLLTFGFMDFQTFVNRGLGLGEWKPVIIIVFWVVVMILIVISQNIVLSIVVRAYDTAIESEPFIEASIVGLLLQRIAFEWRRVMASLRMLSLDAFVEETIKDFLHELYLHGTGKEDLGLFPAYIRARWAIALLPEAIVIRNFFYDFGDQDTTEHSRWDRAFMNFNKISHVNLLRSFEPFLNKVQDEEDVIQALRSTAVSMTHSTVLDRESPLEGAQKSSMSMRDLLLTTVSSFKTGHGEDVNSQQGGVGAGNKVHPEEGPQQAFSGGRSSLAGQTSQEDQETGGGGGRGRTLRRMHSTNSLNGRLVPASTAEPLDSEDLTFLLNKVICDNEAFTGARHLLGFHLNRFNPGLMSKAAEYIMEVYSFPRSKAKKIKRAYVRAASAEAILQHRDVPLKVPLVLSPKEAELPSSPGKAGQGVAEAEADLATIKKKKKKKTPPPVEVGNE